ncbi:MAG: hypothetical protein AAF752_11220 [Bacteroidota bacterium]
MNSLPFVVHLAATLFMTGVIWIVQVVHYPLFAGVGIERFAAYEAAHARLITFVVMPAMLIELGTAFWLLADRPAWMPAWSVWLGVALLGAIWASTAFLQVPAHAALSQGFDAEVHSRLVNTNWVRTVAWSFRSSLLLWVLYRASGGG